MRGFRVLVRAAVLAGTAMLPALAAAQNDSGPQRIPGLDRFNLPPKPTPTPTPPPTGPIIAPFARPTPAATPAPTPAPAATPVTPPPVSTTAPRSATGQTPAARPTPQSGTPAPTASATPQPVASTTPGAVATPEPLPVVTPASTPVPATSGSASGIWIAIGVGIVALLAAGAFLFMRRRRPAGEEELELTEVAPKPVAAPPPPPPAPAPSSHLTVPIRRSAVGSAGPGAVPEPDIEIVLIPRRAGTNLMSAAVDYRVVVRNNGQGEARDIRLGIYLFSASARQAADLQMIFATTVEKPVVAPFTLVPGQEVELSGMAMLPRDNVNVMTIDGKPWFVPVMAMKAEYRWGENVGVSGVATAAHMIGIDRGEGAKMAPFRFDGGPMMHPEVAERKVA